MTQQGRGRASDEPGRIRELALYGERLCLNFANTVDPRHSDHSREFLINYADLVAWAVHAGAVGEDIAGQLRAEAERRPQAAQTTFRVARSLRETVYGVFASLAAGRSMPEPNLWELNRAHAEAMAHARIVSAGDGYVLGWDESRTALDRMLWPVARSAAELLTSGRLDRIRECPGLDGCGWLFYDTSKNGSRRWCSMAGCGNQAKGHRHYRRQRATST